MYMHIYFKFHVSSQINDLQGTLRLVQYNIKLSLDTSLDFYFHFLISDFIYSSPGFGKYQNITSLVSLKFNFLFPSHYSFILLSLYYFETKY